MIVRVPNAGQVGLNKDLSQHELTLGAWTDALNVRFLDGYAWQFYGHGQVYGDPEVTPYHLLPVTVGTDRYWIYASDAKAYCVTISTGTAVHANITRQDTGTDDDYTATVNGWTSTLLGGIPILNNGTDAPQQWDLNPAHQMTDLDNWPSGMTCRALRGYKQFLIALAPTISSVEYPFMVKWSHPAEPGSVPSSWDETDPTQDAGQTDLAEGYDPIVDGLQLRDSFMIYKEASVWRMDYVGGVNVFRFTRVLGTSGAMNVNCIADLDAFHFVLTRSDIVIHDGNQAVSVLDKVTRRWLFQNIDVDNSDKCFVFKNPFFNEVFACFPSIGSTKCDRAIVWNYVDKTVSIRELPDIYCAAYGPVDTTLAGTWASDSAPWYSDLTTWDGGDLVPSDARCLMGTDDKLYLLDSSADFDGVIPSAYLERRGLSFGKPEGMKLIRGIRARVTGNTGETIKIQVGGQSDPWEEPEWGEEMTHVIGTTIADDCLVSGRYIAIKFSTGTAYQWRLDSYDIDVVQVGEW